MKVSKTKVLKETIVKELREICSRVFYQNASKNSNFPYIVYDIKVLQVDFPRKYQLEVNIIDNSVTSEGVDELSDLLEIALCNTFISNNEHKLLIDLNVRNNPMDEPGYKKSRLLYDVVYYGGE